MAERLAERMARVSVSATSEMFARVARLTAEGVDIVRLSVGEPDFDTPPHIIEATKQALDGGHTRYTLVEGTLPLREAIADESARRRTFRHQPDQVVVAAGAKHVLFNLAQALYDPGDRIVIPTPAWVSYAQHAQLCGAEPVLLPTRAEDDFELDPQQLADTLSKGARALVLCTPSNPTGAVLDAARLRDLAEVLRRHDCLVVVDEIYSRLTHDGCQQPSLIQVAPDLAERIVVVDGVSKSFAMTGYRVGWALCSRDIARALTTVQSQATTNIASFAQEAARVALSGDQACVEAMCSSYGRRRDRMLSGLRALDGIECNTPRGAFYVFADISGLLGRRHDGGELESDRDVGDWLLDVARVAVVPGSAFGTPGFVRLSYAVADDRIDEALTRMADAIARLR